MRTSGRSRAGGVLAALLLLAHVTSLQGAETPSEKFTLAIERQHLDTALQQLARQCGVQVIFLSRVTQGLNAPALQGQYTLNAALERLLDESQLTFRVINPQTVEIRPRQARSTASVPTPTVTKRSSESTTLEEVIVSGLAEQLVATRIPTPLWEIPQTLSIISREQIRQQNSVDLGDALRQTPGVTLTRSSSIDGDFYMRGYLVPTLHVDGGAALNPAFLRVSQVSLVPADLSEYDHIEVLRGSDALFSGIGSPGGTVSLVRKTPQRSYALEATATVGSWNAYRAEVDITGPIAFDSDLRGRAAVTSSQRDYFYDGASAERTKIFAALSYDVMPDATLTVGGSYQRDDTVQFLTGLPSYEDGSDPRLPRDSSLVLDWQREPTRNTEAYVQFRQDFADEWALKVNVAHWHSQASIAEGFFEGLIDPATQELPPPVFQFTRVPSTVELMTADATVTGVFDWFGWHEEIALGGDASRQRSRSTYEFYDSEITVPDIRAFDASLYPDPRFTAVPYLITGNRSTADRYGAFASLRVYFNDAWSVVGGVRVGSDTFKRSAEAWRANGVTRNSADTANRDIMTPYAGAMVKLSRQYSLYASYADVYDTMGLFEGPDGLPLEEAHGINLEAGLKGQWHDGAINGALALYRIDSRNSDRRAVPRIPGSPRHGGICCFVAGDTHSRGVDLELNGELARGWQLGLGYSYNENEDARGSPLSMLTPPHLFKAWTSLALPGALSDWTIGGNLYAQSANRIRADYCTPDFECNNIVATQRGYAVLDLRVAFEIDSHWRIALGMNNALDATHYDSMGLPMHRWYGEPRNWTLRLDGRY